MGCAAFGNSCQVPKAVIADQQIKLAVGAELREGDRSAYGPRKSAVAHKPVNLKITCDLVNRSESDALNFLGNGVMNAPTVVSFTISRGLL